jgi:hypothetical protein
MKIFDKLNLKNLTKILVLNAPQSFEPELAALQGIALSRPAHACRNRLTWIAGRRVLSRRAAAP